MLSSVNTTYETPLKPSLHLHIAIPLHVQQMSEEQSYCKSVAKKQQQQAQLSRLPRHHPLLREPHSDEGYFHFHSKHLLCYGYNSTHKNYQHPHHFLECLSH